MKALAAFVSLLLASMSALLIKLTVGRANLPYENGRYFDTTDSVVYDEVHEHEIAIEEDAEGKVTFAPFLGIAPFRYRDIFEKGKRKSGARANEWYRGEPRPMIEISTANAYLDNEQFEAAIIYGEAEQAPIPN